jgi:hypothetical protein
MTMLTSTQLASAMERMHDLPPTQPERFDRRIDAIMHVTGRDRSWARQRGAELWPAEYEQFLAAKAPA